MAKLFEIANIKDAAINKRTKALAKTERRRKARIMMNKLIAARYRLAVAMDVCADEDYLEIKARFEELSESINELRAKVR